ncbi:hypothetical protein N4A85_25295, partial [Escherichia coli]|uniref:hypothetical protein n=1 Tax=Escherichia coli TaxID=562 RepID=UPI0021B588B7
MAIAPQIHRARLYRIRGGVQLHVEGEGFIKGTKLLVNQKSVPTKFYRAKRLKTNLSWGFIGRAKEINIVAQNPDNI